MKLILRVVPFAGIITLNIFAQINGYELKSLQLLAMIIGGVLLINLILAIALRVNDYFIYGISGIGLFGIATLLFAQSIGEIYIHHIISGLYLGLFIVAFFPPLFKAKPFTFAFSLESYSKAVTKGRQFLKINLIINYIWATLFLAAIFLTNIQYSESTVMQIVLAMAIPIALLIVVGVPATIKLPPILMQKIKGTQLHFSTIKELFESMPLGFNKKRGEGVDALIQFELTGVEPTIGYMEIKNQKCTYFDGQHPNPKTIIKCDSKLWLDISNNDVSGDFAFINKQYTVEGDMGILLNFNTLFSSEEDEKPRKMKKSAPKFKYKTFEPGKIKKVVVFDGGPRNESFSKTTFAAKNFCEGVQKAGAEVEYIKLTDKKINPCTGCYTCWTKTPGKCIFNDDMTQLREKYRAADLVVFATPLYIFNVTGTFKTFMDRLLPTLKPYMLMAEDGHTLHPDRYPELGEQGFVVISAAGFPEVDSNYDGLRSMFKMWDTHSENMHMMGEFYITAAELMAQPVYSARKKAVAEACCQAGMQIIKEGKVDISYMETVADPGSSKKTFQNQADNFWESLDGKKAYLTGSPKI